MPDHHDRISDLGTCLNNRDDINAENAARNLDAGLPDYWHRGQTTAAAYVGEHANRIGSLLKALVEWLDKRPSDVASAILDRIIPLNAAAIEEMELCYRLQSTHRDDLADRERRAIYNPVFFPDMSDAVRAGWEDRYAYCQRRFEARQGRGIGPVAALAIALSNASGVDLAARVAVEGEEAA